MSSENEIVDQPDNNQPDLNAESETAVTPVLPPENSPMQSEPEEADLEEEEMDWDSWLLTNPEAEEVEPEVSPDAVADALVSAPIPLEEEDIEVNLADVIMAEFEEDELVEIIEAEEELVELLAEVDALEAVAEAATQAEALETVAEAIAEAEVVAEHVPDVEAKVVADHVPDAEPPQSEEPEAEAPTPPPATPKKPNRKHPQGLAAKDVIRYFAPCGRCGYFLTGYRASYGEANFETAVSEETGGWLTLSWGSDIPELFVKSFGRVVEANDVFFTSACPECYRALTYAAPSGEDQPATFRIEVKPKSGNE